MTDPDPVRLTSVDEDAEIVLARAAIADLDAADGPQHRLNGLQPGIWQRSASRTHAVVSVTPKSKS